MSSLYDRTGIVPASSESESEFPESPQAAALDQTELVKTPPKKSILRPSGVLTPQSGRKSVKFVRKSLSLNVTPACSPAYRDRKSIAREDMANFTFCLENSGGDSPGSRSHASPKPGTSQGTQANKKFDLSTYINMMVISSPVRRSFSTTALNKMGVQSTPTKSKCGSPYSPSVDLGHFIKKRNFFGTPQARGDRDF